MPQTSQTLHELLKRWRLRHNLQKASQICSITVLNNSWKKVSSGKGTIRRSQYFYYLQISVSHEENAGWSGRAGEARPNSRNHQMEALTQATLICSLFRKTRERKEDRRLNRTETGKKSGSQTNLHVRNCIKTTDRLMDL